MVTRSHAQLHEYEQHAAAYHVLRQACDAQFANIIEPVARRAMTEELDRLAEVLRRLNSALLHCSL